MTSTRVPGLQYSFHQARAVLRSRLARLPRHPPPVRFLDDQPVASDVDVLALLQDTTAQVRTAAAAQAEYARLLAIPGSQLPPYFEVLARGWFREIWGAIEGSVALSPYLAHRSPPYGDELREFRSWVWKTTYVVAQTKPYGTAAPLEANLLNPDRGSQTLTSRSPAWISARLWDETTQPDLRQWAIRWLLLGRPRVLPVEVWSEEAAESFRQAVIDAATNGNLPDWKTASAAAGVSTHGDLRKGNEREPEPHLLGMYAQQRGLTALFETEDLDSLLGLLVLELAVREGGEVPAATAKSLVDLAKLHPNVLDVVTQFAPHAPSALADFLLDPRACGLACFLVASWDSQVQVDRESRDASSVELHRAVFEDCLEVLEHFAKNDLVDPQEFMALLVEVQMLDANRNLLSRAELLPSLIEQLLRLPQSFTSGVLSLLVAKAATDGPDSMAFSALLRVLVKTRRPLATAEVTHVVNSYVRGFDGERYPRLELIAAEEAGALVDVAMQHEGPLTDSLLKAVDVAARLQNNVGQLSTALALRSHIRLLSRAVAGFPGSVPDKLVHALAAAIESGARDRPHDLQVDSFSPDLDVIIGARPRRLELDIAEALARLENPALARSVVDAILMVQEPISLAILLRRAPRAYQAEIQTRLQHLQPGDAACAYTTPQLQLRVTALLDAGMPEAADKYRADQMKRLQTRNSSVSPLTESATDLHLRYLREDWDGILGAQPPAGLTDSEKVQAQHTLDYFKALALLAKPASDASKAAAILDRLHASDPSRVLTINLLAAHLARLLPGDPFAMLSADQAKEAEAILAKVDAALPIGNLSEEEGAVHYPNRAALLLAIGKRPDALKSLGLVASASRTPESAAYEAVADARSGDAPRAASLLKAAQQQFGQTRILKAAADHLAGAMAQSAPVKLLTNEDRFKEISSALGVFSGLPATEQAEIVSPGAIALERVLTDAMSDALAAFTRLIPFLKLNHSEYHEDHLNTLVASLMQAHLSSRFGWQAHDQTFGGLTGTGRHGERDFVVKQSGDELAIYEALRAYKPSDAGNMRFHLHKLFGYSNTRLFFHITFSYYDDPQAMMKALEVVAAEPPDGVSFRAQNPIVQQNSRPPGRRAIYQRNGLPVVVVFFLVDMGQKIQRQAVNAPPLASSAPAAAPTAAAPTAATPVAGSPLSAPASPPAAGAGSSPQAPPPSKP